MRRSLLGAVIAVGVGAGVASGEIEFVETVKDGVAGVDGIDGAHAIAMSDDGAFVYATGFDEDAVAVFGRNATTGVLDWIEVERDGVFGVEGLTGANAIAISPDGAHVYVTGETEDAIAVFTRSSTTGRIDFVEVERDGLFGVDGLDEPRQVVVSPDGDHVYVVSSFDDAVALFDRDAATGRLDFVEIVKDGVFGVDGLDDARAILISPDGAHVYVAGRAEDEIALFSRNAATGKLAFVEVERDGFLGVDGLDGVQSLAMDANGVHLYAAGEDDDAIAVFSRNATDGRLDFVEVVRNGILGVSGMAGPERVVLAPNGRDVYVLGSTNDTLAVFVRNVTTGRLEFVESKTNGVGGVSGIASAMGLVVSRAARDVYVTSTENDSIALFEVLDAFSVSTIGLHDPGPSVFFLRNTNGPGPANSTYSFGPAGSGWTALAGDWNGDATWSGGLFDPAASTFFLRNARTNGPADVAFPFGPPGAGWVPIAGDWDGDGDVTVGLFDPAASVFYLRDTHAGGVADVTFSFGPAGAGWRPFAGDWNLDGRDTVGLFDPVSGGVFLRNAHAPGTADVTFSFGPVGSGWTPLAGDWNADGTDSLGLHDPVNSSFFLRNALSSGPADASFQYGSPGAGWTPLAGDWDGF